MTNVTSGDIKRTRVAIYLNVAEDHFFGYQPGDELHKVYDYDVDVSQPPGDVAEQAFRMFNAPMEFLEAAERHHADGYRAGRNRSSRSTTWSWSASGFSLWRSMPARCGTTLPRQPTARPGRRLYGVSAQDSRSCHQWQGRGLIEGRGGSCSVPC